MIGYTIGYTLEIIKFYLIMHCILQIPKRENRWAYGAAVVVVPLFGWLIWNGIDEGVFLYYIYIILMVNLLMKETVWKVSLIGVWLSCLIGVMDSLSGEIIEMIISNQSIALENITISYICSAISITGILLFLLYLKRRGYIEYIKLDMRFYIFYTILSLAYSCIIAYMRIILEDAEETLEITIPLLLCTICMYIQIGIMLILLVSRNIYQNKMELNNEYFKLQEKHYQYLEKKDSEIRNFRHDVAEHFLTITELCENGQNEELLKYMKRIGVQTHMTDQYVTV